MSPTLPDPADTGDPSDPASVAARFLDYLDFYRATVEAKLDGLTDSELRHSPLPSGWTPLELLQHLVFMERRWLRWGFRAERVPTPWGDAGPDGRWRVDTSASVHDLLDQLHDGGRRTRRIVEESRLDDLAASGGRFEPGDRAPTLGWILFHVLQEYARHAGHLDIVRELTDGHTGE